MVWAWLGLIFLSSAQGAANSTRDVARTATNHHRDAVDAPTATLAPSRALLTPRPPTAAPRSKWFLTPRPTVAPRSKWCAAEPPRPVRCCPGDDYVIAILQGERPDNALHHLYAPARETLTLGLGNRSAACGYRLRVVVGTEQSLVAADELGAGDVVVWIGVPGRGPFMKRAPELAERGVYVVETCVSGGIATTPRPRQDLRQRGHRNDAAAATGLASAEESRRRPRPRVQGSRRHRGHDGVRLRGSGD